MKALSDDLLKKNSGGVLLEGWEEEIDEMIAEFNSMDFVDVPKNTEGMILVLKKAIARMRRISRRQTSM